MRLIVSLTLLALITGCDRPAAPAAWNPSAEGDSLRTWARDLEAAFDRFEGCGGGDAARGFYAADSVVVTTDSATMAMSGDALTGMFKSVACTRKESVFALDSVITRPVGPGLGYVTATYVETATDTLGVATRLRGSVSWVVRRAGDGWKASSVVVTEHRSLVR
jgi:hypothetical protein